VLQHAQQRGRPASSSQHPRHGLELLLQLLSLLWAAAVLQLVLQVQQLLPVASQCGFHLLHTLLECLLQLLLLLPLLVW
jgi:hypothetical protein